MRVAGTHLDITERKRIEGERAALEKHLSKAQHLKVLFMSGYADEVIAAQGRMGPGTLFLQKPFTVRSLTAKVREVLDAPDPGPGAR